MINQMDKFYHNLTKGLLAIAFTLILLLFAGLFASLFAQGNPPMIPPGCENPVPGIKNPNCDVDQVPLPGLAYLAIAGCTYAIYKLRNKSSHVT